MASHEGHVGLPAAPPQAQGLSPAGLAAGAGAPPAGLSPAGLSPAGLSPAGLAAGAGAGLSVEDVPAVPAAAAAGDLSVFFTSAGFPSVAALTTSAREGFSTLAGASSHSSLSVSSALASSS